MLAGIRQNLRRGRFTRFPRIKPAESFSIAVDLQHDFLRLFLVHAEEHLQHVGDELHRSNVIIKENDLNLLHGVG
jgi:hypothetical protein